MFNKKTTIVVGAGASNEANLPTGADLKMRIANILDFQFDSLGRRKNNGDNIVFDALRELCRLDNSKADKINLYMDAAWRIRDALPLAMSIDNFIDAHQGDRELEECGKLAIVKSILAAERKSLLYIDTDNADTKLNFQLLNDTWFNAFMQLLTENCTVDQLEDRFSSIEFIVFNYDRCLEHFLYNGLKTYYGVEHNRAAELVRGIKIFHPYGVVGGLPWYGGTHTIKFGDDKVSSRKLIDLANQIKTFTEGTDPESSDVVAIRNGIAQSEIVLFLGFAFHRLNLKLIQPTEMMQTGKQNVRYFATALGISKNDCEIISTEIVKLGVKKPFHTVNLRNDLNCSSLLKEYWRSLSLS